MYASIKKLGRAYTRNYKYGSDDTYSQVPACNSYSFVICDFEYNTVTIERFCWSSFIGNFFSNPAYIVESSFNLVTLIFNQIELKWIFSQISLNTQELFCHPFQFLVLGYLCLLLFLFFFLFCYLRTSYIYIKSSHYFNVPLISFIPTVFCWEPTYVPSIFHVVSLYVPMRLSFLPGITCWSNGSFSVAVALKKLTLLPPLTTTGQQSLVLLYHP